MSKPAAPLSLPEVLQVHQYQYDGSHRNPNECALCAMTTLTTIAARRSGQPGFSLAAAQLGRFLDRIPFRFPRFPSWFPGPGGATHPLAALWGLRAYGRRLRKQGLSFPWKPVLRTKQTPDDLRAALDAGQPTMIYGVGHTGIPHVVIPLEYSAPHWLILDPGSPREQNPARWSDEQLLRWWTNFLFIYPAGTLLTLEAISD